jgi:hypothetical protein
MISFGTTFREPNRGRISLSIICPSITCDTVAFFGRFGAVALSQVGNGRGLAPLPFLTRRIFTAVYAPPKLSGFVARSLVSPFGKAADGEPALAAIDPVVDEKRARALRTPRCRRKDTHSKAGNIGIPVGRRASL